jgi:glycosyltransferase involved in cell wall biosynthesis
VRILVCPNSLDLGGSLNAIEIAAAVRDRGHEVIVLAKPGPLLAVVRRCGLEYIELDPDARRRPSARAIAQQTDLVRTRGIDVVHGYEWPATIEACGGPRLRLRVPTVCTIYSVLVAPFLPRSLPLIVGTLETRDRAGDAGHTEVTLIEPPVDTEANSPSYDPGPFRAELGFDDAPLLVLVSRMAREGKLEGLLAACDAVGRLAASGRKVYLALVGDGPARDEVEQAAAAANQRAGRRVVALTGSLPDPRPAYAAASIVLGMGGSALRGMAFGKPLVVQGEHGFWRLLTPQSAPEFLYQGWYGLGPDAHGRREGSSRLEATLDRLLDDTTSWESLGQYGRGLVTERFSLDRAAAVMEDVYAGAVLRPPSAPRAAFDGAIGFAGAVAHMARRKGRRKLGKPVPADDFNAIAASPQHWRGSR